MFSILIPEKYITSIDASSKVNLYFALKENISSIIPIANISIAPIKYPINWILNAIDGTSFVTK